MTDITYYNPKTLVADAQTDMTDGGLAAGAAGAYFLNFCNDTDAAINLKAIYVTDGEAAADKHKIHPASVVAARSFFLIQPFKLGDGYKMFVEADAAISVQLTGAKEG